MVVGDDPADVVPHDKAEERDDANKGGLVDALFDGGFHVPAGDAFDDEEEDAAAVEEQHPVGDLAGEA